MGIGANWLSLSTAGTRSNRDGLGATITVIGESGLTQHFSVTTGSSYLSASDKRVHVGLGRDKVARSITDSMARAGSRRRCATCPPIER